MDLTAHYAAIAQFQADERKSKRRSTLCTPSPFWEARLLDGDWLWASS
jgi:hypothetical protein